MKDYYSVAYATKNGRGLPEVVIEHHKGFFRSLFNMPRRKEEYINADSIWYEKKSVERVETVKLEEIEQIINSINKTDIHRPSYNVETPTELI